MHSTLPQDSVQLAEIQFANESALLELPNVVGVGIGTKISEKKGLFIAL